MSIHHCTVALKELRQDLDGACTDIDIVRVGQSLEDLEEGLPLVIIHVTHHLSTPSQL